MIDDRDRVVECTTPSYSGVVSVIDPKSSWTAKWLRLGKMVPGCYALEINDDIPEDQCGRSRSAWKEEGEQGLALRGGSLSGAIIRRFARSTRIGNAVVY